MEYMPRPKKWRKVCCLPRQTRFEPVDEDFIPKEAVVMTVDEYETIRLIDHENFTQEECAGYMNVARTTVQQIYFDARKKLASFIVEGHPLLINGGEYQLCDGKEAYCNCGGSFRHRCHRMEADDNGDSEK